MSDERGVDQDQRAKLAEIAEKTPGHQGGPGRDRDPYYHRGGLTDGDARDGATRAAGVLIL